MVACNLKIERKNSRGYSNHAFQKSYSLLDLMPDNLSMEYNYLFETEYLIWRLNITEEMCVNSAEVVCE